MNPALAMLKYIVYDYKVDINLQSYHIVDL